MYVFPIFEWLRSHSSRQFAAQIVYLGRGLLLLIALELVTMPVTQDLWSWDKFLHGGQDFELGLLIIVTCLCLTLLGAEQTRRDLSLLVAARALLLSDRPRVSSPLPGTQFREHCPGIQRALSLSPPCHRPLLI